MRKGSKYKYEGDGYSYMYVVVSFLLDPSFVIHTPFKVTLIYYNIQLIHYVVSHILAL